MTASCCSWRGTVASCFVGAPPGFRFRRCFLVLINPGLSVAAPGNSGDVGLHDGEDERDIGLDQWLRHRQTHDAAVDEVEVHTGVRRGRRSQRPSRVLGRTGDSWIGNSAGYQGIAFR